MTELGKIRILKNPEQVRLPNGEWCYANSDGLTKHGQHIKSVGACNYVNYHLYSPFIAKIAREHYDRQERSRRTN